MTTPSRVRRPSPVRSLGATLAVLLATALVVVPSLATADSGPTVPPPISGGESAAGEQGDVTGRLTLVTGDVVAWQRTASGQQSAWLVDPEDAAAGPPLVYEQDGEVHLVPFAAQAYVDNGVLDANLFNISLLVQEGFDDEARDDWPLLVQGRGRPRVGAFRPCHRRRAVSAHCRVWAWSR